MDHHARHKFYANLKYACSTRVSISDFCREVGLNRQQFNRYINGQAHPSPHNLLRIASAFGLEPGDFTAPPRSSGADWLPVTRPPIRVIPCLTRFRATSRRCADIWAFIRPTICPFRGLAMSCAHAHIFARKKATSW